MSRKLAPCTLALATLCLALASCGGGHSSSTASTTSPSGPAGPGSDGGPTTGGQPTVFDLQGGGQLIVNTDGTAVFQGTALNPGGATARFGGAQVFSGNGLVLERLGSATGLSVADFGAWYALNGPVTATNFFAAGKGGPSVGPALPVSGSATYSGNYIAVVGSSPASGPVMVTIRDFSAPTVAVFLSGPISIAGGGPLNRSTGTYTFSSGAVVPRGGALNGQGALYGNGAPETAGTFSGSTVAEPVVGTSQPFNGSFGAHR